MEFGDHFFEKVEKKTKVDKNTISKEKEDKIIETITQDKVPKGVEKMF